MTTDFLNGKGDPRTQLMATLNYAQDPWHLYAIGYLEAANALVEDLETGSIRAHKCDLLVYPVAYLYRHFLELKIKQLYLKVCLFLGENAQIKLTHTLWDNWGSFRSKLFDAAAKFSLTEQTQEYLEEVEEKLRQFVELDSTSMTFRYPVDKYGNNLLANRSHLHLGQLREFAAELAQDLENIDHELARWIHIQTDWFTRVEFGYEDERE